MNTLQYLDLLAKKFSVNGIPATDSEISRHLEITRGAVSNYRRGISHFDEDVSAKVEEALGLPDGKVLLDMQI